MIMILDLVKTTILLSQKNLLFPLLIKSDLRVVEKLRQFKLQRLHCVVRKLLSLQQARGLVL